MKKKYYTLPKDTLNKLPLHYRYIEEVNVISKKSIITKLQKSESLMTNQMGVYPLYKSISTLFNE